MMFRMGKDFEFGGTIYAKILFFVLFFATGCVDEKACEECIEDQIAVKKLIQKQLPDENIIIPTRDVLRHGCSAAIIAPKTPCAPRYWPLGLGAVILVGFIIWKKQKT